MQKLFDSELKVMELIWANEPISATCGTRIFLEQEHDLYRH